MVAPKLIEAWRPSMALPDARHEAAAQGLARGLSIRALSRETGCAHRTAQEWAGGVGEVGKRIVARSRHLMRSAGRALPSVVTLLHEIHAGAALAESEGQHKAAFESRRFLVGELQRMERAGYVEAEGEGLPQLPPEDEHAASLLLLRGEEHDPAEEGADVPGDDPGEVDDDEV